MASNKEEEKAKALGALTAHSNLAKVCIKYNIAREDVKSIMDEKIIQVTNQKIPINERKGSGADWDDVRRSVNKILDARLDDDTERETLLLLVRNKAGFVNAISDEILDQLKRQYRTQGCLNWLKGDVKDQFHYSQKFGTTDLQYGRAEYLHASGSGTILCTQNKFYKDEVHLDITLRIRAVTVKCDELVWNQELKIDAEGLLRELEWHDVLKLDY